ncbi:6222_t:CDS:2, partial [Ambispora gerdemannii]
LLAYRQQLNNEEVSQYLALLPTIGGKPTNPIIKISQLSRRLITKINSLLKLSNELSSLLTIIGQLLPLAPLAFEQFTGQKVPHMSGTMAEMQMALISIQTNLQVIANNQQALSQRLIALEQNATNQLTNLTNQFKSLRLTHTKEQKQIEYTPTKLENTEESY